MAAEVETSSLDDFFAKKDKSKKKKSKVLSDLNALSQVLLIRGLVHEVQDACRICRIFFHTYSLYSTVQTYRSTLETWNLILYTAINLQGYGTEKALHIFKGGLLWII